MELAAILQSYKEQVMADPRFQRSATNREQKHALHAITACRTAACGEILVSCPSCREMSWAFHSCGHRSCPKCQNHETSRWLYRQRLKLLPGDYYLVTFTLPAELRALARRHPKSVYNLIFDAAVGALKDAASNPKYFGGLNGCTGALHTHSRRLDFHPHIHFVVPGLAWHPKTRVCVHTKNSFLIPGKVLGWLFRGKLLAFLKQHGFYFDTALYRKEWVVDSLFSGQGDSALKYLSRYLYRGVISERNIISHQNGEVTFQYKDSETKKWLKRTLPSSKFAQTVLQHTLPKGFRRVRDYGFLHGNAKKTLGRIQLRLKPKLVAQPAPKRPSFRCPCCRKPAVIVAVGVFRRKYPTRIRSPPMPPI